MNTDPTLRDRSIFDLSAARDPAVKAAQKSAKKAVTADNQQQVVMGTIDEAGMPRLLAAVNQQQQQQTQKF